jgi:ActR/RegA family two-component response regulator
LYNDTPSQFPPSPFPSPAYRALVVEDDEDAREGLCRLLRRLGCATDGAGSVREAIAKLRTAPPDVMILDLILQDGSGLAVLRQVCDRELPVDVAVLTGMADGDLVADAILLHPDALFTKPADLTEIASWLAACQARRQRRQQQQPPPPSRPDAPDALLGR